MAEVTKLRAKYDELAEKARNGDAQAFKDKAKAMQEIREHERAENRKGKASLQQEYVRKFDDETPVVLEAGAAPTTLRAHHEKRLGVRG
jgi:hypothetical protein